MTVILDPPDYDVWLDPTRGDQELLRPCPEEWLEAVPVSMNSPSLDDATIIQPEGPGAGASDPGQAALSRGLAATTGLEIHPRRDLR